MLCPREDREKNQNIRNKLGSYSVMEVTKKERVFKMEKGMFPREISAYESLVRFEMVRWTGGII